MRARYVIAVLLVTCSFTAYGQTQLPSADQKPTPTTNSAVPGTVDLCNKAHEGGSFAARYLWYVRVVQAKVSEIWVKYEQDPQIQSASRICLNFDINRAGEPSNIRIEQSSGVPSLDQSALRAVKSVSSFGPLPKGYEGDKVSVLFYFDYKPKQAECTAEDYVKSSAKQQWRKRVSGLAKRFEIIIGQADPLQIQSGRRRLFPCDCQLVNRGRTVQSK